MTQLLTIMNILEMLVCSLYSQFYNIGSFDANDDDVGTGIAGAPACGDVMKLQVNDFCAYDFLD